MNRNMTEAERDWLETPLTDDENEEIEDRKQADIENDYEELRMREVE